MRGIAQREAIDSVDRNVMVNHQIAHDRVRHLLRPLNTSLTTRVGISLYLYDVTLLALQLSSYLIKSLFCLLVQRNLRGAEVKFHIRDLLVLI